MKKVYVLKKSKRKGKRFVLAMPDEKHQHHFGSDIGITYVDGRTDSEKRAWIARHRQNKNYNNPHSGIYWARHLLWNKESLKQSIKDMEKKLNIKIVYEPGGNTNDQK